MTIEEIEALLKPREIKFIEFYEETSNATDSAQRAGYSPENSDAAQVTACRLLKRPKIIAYRRTRTLDTCSKRNILPEKILIIADDILKRSMQGTPHMKWNKATKTDEPDGTWEYDAKTTCFILKLMSEILGMVGKQVPLSEPQETIEEYLKRMGEEA
jgi:phage terminase small subunit